MARRNLRYKPSRKDFGEYLLSDDLRDAVAECASDIGDRAGNLSPVDSGLLRTSFEVRPESGTMKVNGSHRVQVNVVNETPWAAANEFGGKNNRRVRMLGRAGAEYGDFKPDDGLIKE